MFDSGSDPKVEESARTYLLEYYGPSATGANLVRVSRKPSSRFIRRELRRRGQPQPDDELVSSAPAEHQLVFRIRQELGLDTPSFRYIVVFMDNSGNLLDIIESG